MEVISRKCKGQGKVIFFPCPLLIIIFLLYRVTKVTGTVVELVSLVAQFVRVPDTAFAPPHLCKVLLPVPDGTLTFLIALPPFQNHKINQYIFLQLYYSLFLLSHNHRNFALVPLNTNESVRSRCLASANASNDLQNDKNLL